MSAFHVTPKCLHSMSHPSVCILRHTQCLHSTSHPNVCIPLHTPMSAFHFTPQCLHSMSHPNVCIARHTPMSAFHATPNVCIHSMPHLMSAFIPRHTPMSAFYATPSVCIHSTPHPNVCISRHTQCLHSFHATSNVCIPRHTAISLLSTPHHNVKYRVWQYRTIVRNKEGTEEEKSTHKKSDTLTCHRQRHTGTPVHRCQRQDEPFWVDSVSRRQTTD